MKNTLYIFVFALLFACNEKIDLRPELYPVAGSEQIDIENDGYIVSLNAEAPADEQQGRWYITSGRNGELVDSSLYNTEFSGEPGQVYVLQWMLSDEIEDKSAYTTVSFKAMNPVLYMDVADTIHNMYLHLHGNTPKFGASGLWEIVEGENGVIENADSYEASLWGDPEETYTIRYSHTYGEAKESEEFKVTLGEFEAFAGDDKFYFECVEDDTFRLTSLWAELPHGATGKWEIIEGENGEVKFPTDPTSLFHGLPDVNYQLKWSVNYQGITDVDTVSFIMLGEWGRFTDTRDNNVYRTVKINDLEWFVDNFRYNYYNESGYQDGNWYYGLANNSTILHGDPVDTPEERLKYGKLYPLEYALGLAPEGWRVPTEEEWLALCNLYGGVNYAGAELQVGGESSLELTCGGYHAPSTLTVNPFFAEMEVSGTYWCNADIDNIGMFEIYVGVFQKTITENEDGTSEEIINTGVSMTPVNSAYALSVRYVRDIN